MHGKDMCRNVPVFISQRVRNREILWVWKRKVIGQSTVKARAAKAVFSRPRKARMSSCSGAWSQTSERRRLSQRLSTAESIQKGPSESASAATEPDKYT